MAVNLSALRVKYIVKVCYKVIKLSEFTWNIIFCAQIFVNNCAVQNQVSSALAAITQQDLWYPICQLIMGQTVINRAFVWNGIVLIFDEMNPQYPSIAYSLKDYPIKEYNDSLYVAYITSSLTPR